MVDLYVRWMFPRGYFPFFWIKMYLMAPRRSIPIGPVYGWNWTHSLAVVRPVAHQKQGCIQEHLSSYSWNQYSTFHTLERNPGFVVFSTKAGYVNVSLLIWTRSYYRPTVMYTLEMVGQCQPSTFANKGLNLILFELFLFSTHTSCKDISL